MTRSGPPPKDPKMKRRRNKDLVESIELPSTPIGSVKSTPSVDPTWHSISRQLYMSYASSPAAAFFEPSDWAQLRYVCAFISSILYKGEYGADYPDEYKIGLDAVASTVSALEDFLTTEATRRRLRISIDPSKTIWSEPLPYWHELATDWFMSLRQSGQSMYYQSTDIAFAVLVAEIIHRHVSSGMNGKMMATITRACSLLLTTESARRLAQMELAKAADDSMDAHITSLMEEYARDI
ncbi:hypothetical protein [Streptomyces sp. NBC_00197]|uniref:phage terminase small subunit n=1 Tax=Streptomyces sp. NBC_00197 TaxID=2975676 RepID=UPI00324B5FDE